MLGSGGCIPAEKDFLKAIRYETKQHNICLIFDEVITSRNSSGGLQKILEIQPDLYETNLEFIGNDVLEITVPKDVTNNLDFDSFYITNPLDFEVELITSAADLHPSDWYNPNLDNFDCSMTTHFEVFNV